MPSRAHYLIEQLLSTATELVDEDITEAETRQIARVVDMLRVVCGGETGTVHATD